MNEARVYKYGALAPDRGADIVAEQLLACTRYANTLCAIERGRRVAVRDLLAADDDVALAAALLRAATKSDRKPRLQELVAARRRAMARLAPEMAEIKRLDGEIRRLARAHTPVYWGSYLGVEAAADAARREPLYGEDGLESLDPHFRREVPFGQVGVQLQATASLTVEALLGGEDRRARLVHERPDRRKDGWRLYLRVGSEGRDPIWASWPVLLHRPLPAGALVRWIRVSRRREGPWVRWSCEVTLELPEVAAPSLRSGDVTLGRHGTIALEPCWEPAADGALRVARWVDDAGASGEVLVSARIAGGLRKSADIRSVRDQITNAVKPVLAEQIEVAGDAPAWLRVEAKTMALWRSPARLAALDRRWTAECPDVAPKARAILRAWAKRDLHLWSYETGARRGSLGARLDHYRVTARCMADRYARIVLPDRDLRYAARWGADADVRQQVSPSQLVGALVHAFGEQRVVWVRWRKQETEKGDRIEWLDGALEVGAARAAEIGEIAVVNGGRRGGAWAERKRRAVEARAARQALANVTK